MLTGKADTLSSKFHLSYNMLLNCIRVETADVETLIQKSFFTFQQLAALPGLQAELAEIHAHLGNGRRIRQPRQRAAWGAYGEGACGGRVVSGAGQLGVLCRRHVASRPGRAFPLTLLIACAFAPSPTAASPELKLPKEALVTELHAARLSEMKLLDQLRVIVNQPIHSLPFLQASPHHLTSSSSHQLIIPAHHQLVIHPCRHHPIAPSPHHLIPSSPSPPQLISPDL